MAPCETVAFVRLPGQRVNVEGNVPVFELEQLMSHNIRHFANDMVMAASPEMLPILSKLIRQLKGLRSRFAFVWILVRMSRCGSGFSGSAAPISSMCRLPLRRRSATSYLKRAFDIVFSLMALTLAAVPCF